MKDIIKIPQPQLPHKSQCATHYNLSQVTASRAINPTDDSQLNSTGGIVRPPLYRHCDADTKRNDRWTGIYKLELVQETAEGTSLHPNTAEGTDAGCKCQPTNGGQHCHTSYERQTAPTHKLRCSAGKEDPARHAIGPAAPLL